jgi:hypothetical protein
MQKINNVHSIYTFVSLDIYLHFCYHHNSSMILYPSAIIDCIYPLLPPPSNFWKDVCVLMVSTTFNFLLTY